LLSSHIAGLDGISLKALVMATAVIIFVTLVASAPAALRLRRTDVLSLLKAP
jgi:hypothetical protein